MPTYQQNYYRRKKASLRHPADPEFRKFSEEEQRAFEDAMSDIWEDERQRALAEGRY